MEETRRAPEWNALFKSFADPYRRLTPEEYAAAVERNGFRGLRLQTEDYAWDFGSRATCFVSVAGNDAFAALPQRQHLRTYGDNQRVLHRHVYLPELDATVITSVNRLDLDDESQSTPLTLALIKLAFPKYVAWQS